MSDSPRRRIEAWAAEKPEVKQPLHIDLYNFENPEYEGSKYVLTSPRSLDACSALGIKPVELLYRPLLDVQEELLPRGLPMRTIYSVYEQTERERQNLLGMCREERQKLMDTDDQSNIKTKKRVTIKDSHTDSDDSGTEVDVDDGSLQRQRTKWTTSIGHERITKEELEKRAQDLHARALALREATLTIKSTPRRPKRKSAGAKKGTTYGSGVKNGLMIVGNNPRKSVNFKPTMKAKTPAAATGNKLR